MRKNRRAQTSIEYMLVFAITIALIAAIMVPGLRELEVQLALGGARIGGENFASANPYYSLGRIEYSTNYITSTINISPRFLLRGSSTAPAEDWVAAQNTSFTACRKVFAPNDNTESADYCFAASYYTYCISPVISKSTT